MMEANNTTDVLQFLKPRQTNAVTSSQQKNRPRSQSNMRSPNKSRPQSAKADLSVDETKNKRLILKHYGGTCKEKVRVNKLQNYLDKCATFQGFYPSNQVMQTLPNEQCEKQNKLDTTTSDHNNNSFTNNQNDIQNGKKSSNPPKKRSQSIQITKNTNSFQFQPQRLQQQLQQNENTAPERINQKLNGDTPFLKNRSVTPSAKYKRVVTQEDMHSTPKDSLLGFYTQAKNTITEEDDKVSRSGCYKTDNSFLDNISLNDPKLMQLFNEDLLKSKQFDIEAVVEENADYLQHLFGNCACFKCSCGRCRCEHGRVKKIFRNGMSTSYAQQFKQKKQVGATPPLNCSNYETLAGLKRQQPAVDPNLLTTHKNDYKEHELQPRDQKEKFKFSPTPFLASSHYQTNFIDWKDYDPTYIFKRPPHNSVVPECPIRGKTTYALNFRYNGDKIENANANDIKNLQKNQPFPNTYVDPKQSQYSKTFQNFHPANTPNSKLPFKFLSETEKFNSTPTWQAQYQSINKIDFKSPKNQTICPSSINNLTKPWKLKLIQKLKAAGFGATNSSISHTTKKLAKSIVLPHRY